MAATGTPAATSSTATAPASGGQGPAPKEKTQALLLLGGGHARASTRAALAELLWSLPWLQVTITDDWDRLRWTEIAPFDVLITYTGGRDHACAAEQLGGVQKFLERGGGFAPLHFSTADANPQWLALIGAKFLKHPPHGPFTVRVADATHPITRGLDTIEIEDECYTSEYPDRSSLHVLQTSHHPDPAAGIDGEPSAWVKEIGNGRLFYSALGHDARSFANTGMRELFTRGIAWAARREL